MSHRLWFRLDEVVPLAEHAMHCLGHEPAAGAPDDLGPAGPALIWTSTASLDLLTSTGLPTWYGRNGTPHAAEAQAWRDPHGRYQTAGRDGYTTACLPLTSDSGIPGPVIHLLRSRVSRGKGWLTLDIDPADPHLMDAYRVHVVSDRDDLVLDGAVWRPGLVTCPQVADRTYWGLVADHTTNGGDLIVRFTRGIVEQIADDLQARHAAAKPAGAAPPGPAHPGLGFDGDVLAVYRLDPGHVQPHRTTDHLTPDSDNRYPLGAYVWPWRYATEPTTGGAGHGRHGI
ncbi:hypothetical protein [Actinoplanes aureus]|uniref:Uncharacterized protein n=1 Tax=Actinoplanes aureus TaxID=2792083 RepID=A0A931CJF5_9ACTN|nr:hypothetical protein [Actinoplanes aureus]MBG0568221.1 hypothetical protein [Actinoplanes aureus]